MVVVVDSGSVSRRASNALIVPLRRKKVEFSAPIWSRRYSEQGPWVSVEASSIPSDPQRRKPDDGQTVSCSIHPISPRPTNTQCRPASEYERVKKLNEQKKIRFLSVSELFSSFDDCIDCGRRTGV